MVKLRLIQGGKEDREPETHRIRLFSAYSLVDNFRGHDRVRLNWIHLQRRIPPASYGRLIEGYAQINERVRIFFEDYVKELFTEQEIDLLSGYLRGSLRAELVVNEEPVPISSVFMPMPFRQLKPGGPRGFFKPAVATESNLSFDFCAYYDLSRCPPSLAIQPVLSDNGVEFLRESLKYLGIDSAIYEPLLNATVEKVYDEKGLLVDRGKTREEKMRERSRFFKIQVLPKN